jgi:lipopolysaccharide/colanic/teichoic acid biosynthesis glycosyltransferase
LLLAALPVLLLTALVIWMSSPGPVLFRQMRIGRGFSSFEILKLRTMAHAEAGLAYTLGPDPRITPFGRWLRRSKLDELPQLWNVLRGEMSLVGPRPVVPELATEFQIHYEQLLRARPGLTDPASLKYSQETRLLALSPDPMRFFKDVVTPDKIRISLDYMDTANLWTDLATMAMTAVICCLPAMSRLYGRLPEPAATFGPVRAELSGVAVRRPTARDSAVFSHQLAFLEAVAERELENPFAPWILLHKQRSRSQSTSPGVQEEASRL